MQNIKKYFDNINYIDSLLNPFRRGISKKLINLFGISYATVTSWKSGTIPYSNTLKRYAEILSKELNAKYKCKIEITAEQLRDGDIKQIIDDQLKEQTTVTPDPNINPGIVSEPKIEYVAETEIASGLQAFIDSPEWQLARVTTIESEFLKSIRFRSTGKPTKEDFIQLLLIYRGIQERDNSKSNGG